jgi:hypothetical protein
VEWIEIRCKYCAIHFILGVAKLAKPSLGYGNGSATLDSRFGVAEIHHLGQRRWFGHSQWPANWGGRTTFLAGLG